jgi:hypothetical protein
MFKEGDFLRHRSKPEWGTGKVVWISGDKIEVRFPHGPVKLRLDIAGTMLEAAEAPAKIPGKGKAQASAGSGRTAPCEVCGIALNRSRRSADGHWKSCPECSVRDGVEHVFWPFPENFGVSQARVSGEDAEGAQSHCASCRSRGASNSGDRRSCGQFAGMLEV